MIQWKTQSNTSKKFVADVGDLHLILKRQSSYWQLSMCIRVYSQDTTKNMLRPAVVITKFDKDYTATEAKQLTLAYLENFLAKITQALT